MPHARTHITDRYRYVRRCRFTCLKMFILLLALEEARQGRLSGGGGGSADSGAATTVGNLGAGRRLAPWGFLAYPST